jgi:hypothetical protein
VGGIFIEATAFSWGLYIEAALFVEENPCVDQEVGATADQEVGATADQEVDATA